MYSHLLGGSNTYPPRRQKNIPWEHKVKSSQKGEKSFPFTVPLLKLAAGNSWHRFK